MYLGSGPRSPCAEFPSIPSSATPPWRQIGRGLFHLLWYLQKRILLSGVPGRVLPCLAVILGDFGSQGVRAVSDK